MFVKGALHIPYLNVLKIKLYKSHDNLLTFVILMRQTSKRNGLSTGVRTSLLSVFGSFEFNWSICKQICVLTKPILFQLK